MKITTMLPHDLYEGYVDIILETIEGKKYLTFGGGEPEDNCLARDLKDALFIDELLARAYRAGKNGEELEIIRRQKTEDDE